MEHKTVIAVYPELVKEFLKTKPKEWQVYIETMYAMAAGVEKKYWKFLKDMVVEKKERKKKKEPETKGTKIEQEAEKIETKTETKTEPAASAAGIAFSSSVRQICSRKRALFFCLRLNQAY